MAINYVAYDQNGQRVAGTLPVDTEQAAEALLWRANLTVVSLRKQPKAFSASLYDALPTFFGPKPRDLVDFSRGVATLLEAGITLLPAIRFVSQRVRSPLLLRALRQIMVEIETGSSLSEAVAKHPNIFPSIFVRLVTTSEQTGQIAPALYKAADYMERMAAAASKVKRALAYPAIVSVVALGAAFIMLFFAIPAMSVLFEEFGGELPLTTRILINSSGFAQAHGAKMGLGFLLVGGAGWYYFLRSERGKRSWDQIILRLPVFGEVVRYSNTSRVTGSLATLLSAGLPILESLDLTAAMVPNSAVRRSVLQVRQDVVTGEDLSVAMAKHPVFPSLVTQMITMGEQSGTLDKSLETVARFFEQEMDVSINTMTGMLGPLMTLLMGSGVGFIAVAMISAMYGLIDNIK
ncbi:MAG: type II secretion system F family protein [Chloroflexi bacterium]|nr:type II secretion system F family protein [Chloroflexota bacterium]